MNEITFHRADEKDYEGIVALQKANLLSNLDPTELADGFLSMEFSVEQFREMNNDFAVMVAEMDAKIIGYLCGTSCDYGRRFEIIRAMILKLGALFIDGERLSCKNTFIYGPVCVAKPIRGKGLLEGLFGALKTIAEPRYSFCILFIADSNRRSLRAHLKDGYA